jgi:hypothetical protein
MVTRPAGFGRDGASAEAKFGMAVSPAPQSPGILCAAFAACRAAVLDGLMLEGWGL